MHVCEFARMCMRVCCELLNRLSSTKYKQYDNRASVIIQYSMCTDNDNGSNRDPMARKKRIITSIREPKADARGAGKGNQT